MRANTSKGRERWLLLLLALALVHGLIYVAVTPPWQAPDETGHFEYAWLIAHEGRLATESGGLSPAFEGELLSSLYEWRYGDFIARPLPAVMPTRVADLPDNVLAHNARTVLSGRPSLAYLWQALFLLPVREQDLALQLLLARVSSVLLNLAIVWLAFRIFTELLPARPRVALAMALVVVLLPQHTFINSTVGDGTLAELMACVVLYFWVLLFQRGARPAFVLGIALGTLAAVLSKGTALFVIPLDLALALWWLLRRRQLWTRRRFAYLGIALVALGIGAWVASYSGLADYTLRAIQGSLSAPRLSLADTRGTTLDQALLTTHDSFWANFGWMALPAGRWYGAILALTLIAALGWLSGKQDEQDIPAWVPIMMAAALLAALAVYAWAALLSSNAGVYQTQGRYLFPVTIPVAFMLAGGWLKWLPARRENLLLAGVLFLAVFDMWSVLGYIVPYFYYR